MDLTLSLIQRVSKKAKNSLSVGTCSVVLGLGSKWTWTGQEMVWGHWNEVECPLSSVVKGLGSGWTWMGQETVWGHWNKVECPLTICLPKWHIKTCCLGPGIFFI